MGLTLEEARIPDQTNLMVVAVHKRDGDFIYNPFWWVEVGELATALIVIADNEQRQNLNKLTGDTL